MQTSSHFRLAVPALLLACLASVGLAGAQPAPAGDPPPETPSPAPGGRPALKRIK